MVKSTRAHGKNHPRDDKGTGASKYVRGMLTRSHTANTRRTHGEHASERRQRKMRSRINRRLFLPERRHIQTNTTKGIALTKPPGIAVRIVSFFRAAVMKPQTPVGCDCIDSFVAPLAAMRLGDFLFAMKRWRRTSRREWYAARGAARATLRRARLAKRDIAR